MSSQSQFTRRVRSGAPLFLVLVVGAMALTPVALAQVGPATGGTCALAHAAVSEGLEGLGVQPTRPSPAACSHGRTSRGHGHHVAPGPRSGRRVRNTFGRSIFGIAAGGALQNEVPVTLRRDLTADRSAGSRWLRVDINWAQIQAAGPASYDWSAVDRLVRDARARGLKVLGGILYTPSWARPAGTPAIWGPQPADYARFAAAAAAHYAGLGVHAYEVWNEPNNTLFWAPRPSPAAYAAVLRAAYPAIKRADPRASVITGGTAPEPSNGQTYSPVDFLSGIYAHGGKGSFDAVGHHPYCWPAFPGARAAWSAWYQMYGTHRSLRSVMIAHGDRAKKIWATEFGAPTDGPRGSYVTKSVQSRMVTRAYRLFASYRWAGPLFFYQGRDAGDSPGTVENFFGFLNHNFTRKPSFVAYARAAASL
jgi:hypothetical protein